MTDVVVLAAAVDVTKFITASDASKEAFKTATLLKTLNINAIIVGEIGVGKESLSKYILPNASVIDATNFDELLTKLESSEELIITNIDRSPNIKTMLDYISKNSVRVVATSKQLLHNEYVDDVFSIKLNIPPLSQREEDVAVLIEKFVQDAIVLFGHSDSFNVHDFKPDLSKNAKSLKRQVIINYLLQDIKSSELMEIIENFLYTKIGSNNDYKEFLHLYEAPLIRAGLKKFKSQLQLSDKLGLNRNTLRKKIADNQQYLEEGK